MRGIQRLIVVAITAAATWWLWDYFAADRLVAARALNNEYVEPPWIVPAVALIVALGLATIVGVWVMRGFRRG